MQRKLFAAIAGAAVLLMHAPAFAEPTLVGGEARCCQSEKGPEPVAGTGRWLAGTYSRASCVKLTYGFWDGDTPNVARKVCSLPSRTPPEDPVPPPPEEGRGH